MANRSSELRTEPHTNTIVNLDTMCIDITPVIEDIASIGVANMTVKVTRNLHKNKNREEREKRSMAIEDNDKGILVIYSQDTEFFKQLNAIKNIWERKTKCGNKFGFKPSQTPRLIDQSEL